ncbi:hypothetical protein Glove_320g86 [Diversispora epigaea]|uniref:Uncharacterized protein n=1 Tax=Diversispora epigaea TaxID=1348612 RepID=A0A397HNM9_9GLOM|nr:hypothetical protein Glove_320g86 [Diversispora epigaea]
MTKFQQEENSPIQKGKNVEKKIEKLLTDANIKYHPTCMWGLNLSGSFIVNKTYSGKEQEAFCGLCI